MNQPLFNDLRAVWLVRSRVLQGDLKFWLVVAGYDTRTSSFNNQLYLVYVVIFFALWIFMVLTLLADFAARFLKSLPFGSISEAAVGIGALAALGLFLYELFQASSRSPFIFSEADAHLLCSAPIDRRPVALIWLLGAWIERGLFVWAGAVVLGYALLQAQSPHELTPADLPAYLVAGVRMFSIAVPLYLAVLGFAWAVGAWRLRGARESANLRWTAPFLLVVLLAAGAAAGLPTLIFGLFPITFFIRSGLDLAAWSPGFVGTVVMAVAALVVLWITSREMSLARAAQETHDREAIQAARMTWRFDLLDELAQRERLKAGRAPTRLPAFPGTAALVWKNALQTDRRFQITSLLPWLGIAALVLGFLTLSGWGTRGWGIVGWVLLASAQFVTPLRRDLSRWWIFRQLPIPSEQRVSSVLVQPIISGWLAGLVGLGVALLLRTTVPWYLIMLYFVAVPTIALASAIDLLRQSKSQDLLVGRVPDLTLGSLLLALVLLALEGGFAYLLLIAWEIPAGMSAIFLAGESLGILYALWLSAGNMLRHIS